MKEVEELEEIKNFQNEDDNENKEDKDSETAENINGGNTNNDQMEIQDDNVMAFSKILILMVIDLIISLLKSRSVHHHHWMTITILPISLDAIVIDFPLENSLKPQILMFGFVQN